VGLLEIVDVNAHPDSMAHNARKPQPAQMVLMENHVKTMGKYLVPKDNVLVSVSQDTVATTVKLQINANLVLTINLV